MSDIAGNFEGLLFSESLSRYEDTINSGLPLLVSVTIDKQTEDSAPRVMVNTVETLDKAISETASGLVIHINNKAAVRGVKEILLQDKKGRNKVYIKPDDKDWDIRIELPDGFAFANDDILSKIRSVSGVASVKEI